MSKTSEKEGSIVIRSPLKWAGGKSRLLDKIFGMIPEEYICNRFIDVFGGSGVVGVNAMQFKNAWINDYNKDLITFFDAIKNDKSLFLESVQKLFTLENNNLEAYVRFRASFNEDKNLAPIDKAALFLYLNRHCFNGLCRYNKSGGFNVPFGKLVKPPRLDVECIEAFSEAIRNVTTSNLSFEKVIEQAVAGDVVYCDPPYSPLDQKTNFTSYSGKDFGVKIQIELARLSREASERGVLVIISNHNTEATRELYAAATRIESFGVHRSISRNGADRKEVSELLAAFHPKK